MHRLMEFCLERKVRQCVERCIFDNFSACDVNLDLNACALI